MSASTLKTNMIGLTVTSEYCPSQHLAPPHDFGRKRGIAEVDGQPSVAEGDANHPKRTWRNRSRVAPLMQLVQVVAVWATRSADSLTVEIDDF